MNCHAVRLRRGQDADAGDRRYPHPAAQAGHPSRRGPGAADPDHKDARRRRSRGVALTAAELRLLPLLSTHLSFAEIAAELFVSPNTAKTHAVSIYRKLDAGTRGQAVTRARELGLLEG